MTKNKYAEFLEVNQALAEDMVPTKDRYLLYFQYSWLHHPIKRLKQKYYFRKLEKQ